MKIPTLILLILALAVPASGLPDPSLSTATSNAGPILISPERTRFTLGSEDLVVHVTVLDFNANPIAGYPRQDIWLGPVPGDDRPSICPQGSIADADTDANGSTTISGAIAGGGWTQNGLQVYLGGLPLLSSPLAIVVNSPDITGDRHVDLSDVAEFGFHFFDGVYDFPSDFDHNGSEDIRDLTIIADHIGEACP